MPRLAGLTLKLQKTTEERMESLIGIVFMLAIGYWLYKAGKRTGSIKGFGAGLRRSRKWPLRGRSRRY